MKVPLGRNIKTKLSLSATSPIKHKSVFDMIEQDEALSQPSTPKAKVNLFHLKDKILG